MRYSCLPSPSSPRPRWSCCAGATPVFVDVRPDTFNMDVESLEAAIDEAKTAWPQSARGDPGRSLRPAGRLHRDQPRSPRRMDLIVVADAAQSFGASLDGKKVGTLADYTATSFYPSKPLGGYGDGGAILTDGDDKAQLLVALRCHGKGPDRPESEYVGLNSRLDTDPGGDLAREASPVPERDRSAAGKRPIATTKVSRGCRRCQC